jgi:hypothetical protein
MLEPLISQGFREYRYRGWRHYIALNQPQPRWTNRRHPTEVPVELTKEVLTASDFARTIIIERDLPRSKVGKRPSPGVT